MGKSKKFGIFGGVFTPSILTLLGVIMYMRLPWIVGQAGLVATLGIILVAHIISGSTGLSVSSIATDKRVETGGTYYIISRSLGLPIGGTLGWALYVGLSFSVSLYLIGFAEVFLGVIGMDVNLNTIRIAGSAILLLVTFLTFFSTSLAIKTQYIILCAMILSLLSVFFGNHAFTPVAPGIDTLPDSLPWITLFAIFFPAVTGFEAGVSMSGDLKDPRKAIPVGTITAILVGLAIYIGLSFFFAYTVDRNLLVHDPNVLLSISLVPQLVTIGILGATLSSALGSILGAPRILQAVAKDRIAPALFGKGFGASNEPRNAVLLTFLIAESGILIGELNVIARIVTIFFIITYGFLNITYAVESWANSDFRPTFKIPSLVSIIGAIACVVVMIQLDIAALGSATVILLALFFFLKNKELTLRNGDTRSSIWLSLVKMGLLRLNKSQLNNRFWRPNIILFSGGAKQRPYLIEIGKAIVGKQGIFTNFELEEQPDKAHLFDKVAQVTVESIGDELDIITRKHLCNNIYEGIEMISRIYGFSGFEPNTLLMGWPKNAKNTNKFEGLLSNMDHLDYSQIFLNFDKEAGFGNYNKIDCWWSGEGRNLALTLHLIRFITSNVKWRNAEIRILAVAESSKIEKYYAVMDRTLEHYRVKATVKILNNLERIPLKELIHMHSSEAELTILGIPDFTEKSVSETVSQINELICGLSSTLLIRASSGFDEINVSPDLPVSQKVSSKSGFLNEQDHAIIDKLDVSEGLPFSKDVIKLAGELNEFTRQLDENVFQAICANRNSFLEQLDNLANKALSRLETTSIGKKQTERNSEYLKTLNDYDFHARNQLDKLRTDHLNYEREVLQSGIQKYLSQINGALKALPEKVTLTFSKEEYKQLIDTGKGSKLYKKLALLRHSFFNKKVLIVVKSSPSARYYLYTRRLEELMRFQESYATQSLNAFAGIRDFLLMNHDTIEKVQTTQLTAAHFLEEEVKISASIKVLSDGNLSYLSDRRREFIDSTREDLEGFCSHVASPQANMLNNQLKPLNKRWTTLERRLQEYREVWFPFMENHMNRNFLDFTYLFLKNRLAAKIGKIEQEVESRIDTEIVRKLQDIEIQIRSLLEPESPVNNHEVLTMKDLSLPQLDTIFTTLIKEIHETVEELPENLVINGNQLLESIRLRGLEDAEAYNISVRKTADYYISNLLSDQIRKQLVAIAQQLSQTKIALKEIISVANFNLSYSESGISDTTDISLLRKQRNIISSKLTQDIKSEIYKVSELNKSFRIILNKALDDSFEPLSAAAIIKSSVGLKKLSIKSDQRELFNRVSLLKDRFNNSIVSMMVKLFYRKSEGLLWANRLEIQNERASLYPYEPVKKMLESYSPNKAILEKLPFYYHNLFSESTAPGTDFWVGMKPELEKGSQAIKRFYTGTKGLLIVSGERTSGKSSLSRHLAELHFAKQNIYSLRAPKECTADVDLFDKMLLKKMNGNGLLTTNLEEMNDRKVIIINDLELWWERKPGGTAVIERIIFLMREYGNKLLFIVNVNKYALRIINQLTSISIWALDLLYCRPFDARELKDLIMVRHQAGGMKLVLNKKNDDQITNWDYASLFNRFFNLSLGNPGYAINLWLTGIKSISGNTIYITKPADKRISFPDEIQQEEIIVILQFILHRRFSIGRLSTMLDCEPEYSGRIIQTLFQKGILIEVFTGIYAIHPAIEIHLVKKLINIELL